MATLERFLVKKQVIKSAEESKQEEIPKQGLKTEIASTLNYLKGIFINESDHELTLLALQHPDPRDLEEVVQRILDSGKALQDFKDAWSTVKPRDKKKPESQKNYKNKRFQNRVEQENEAIPGYNVVRKRNKNHKNEERRPERPSRPEPGPKVHQRPDTSLDRLEKSADEDSSILKAEENSRSIEETKKNTEESRHTINDSKALSKPAMPSIPSISSNPSNPSIPPHKPTEPQPDFPSLVSDSSWAQTPPQVINTHKTPNPPAIIEDEKQSKLPAHISEKILSPSSPGRAWAQFQQKPETRDFAVQVEMDLGVPIIVYPYMCRQFK